VEGKGKEGAELARKERGWDFEREERREIQEMASASLSWLRYVQLGSE